MPSQKTQLPILDVDGRSLTLLNGQKMPLDSEQFRNWLLDETDIFIGADRINKAICHVQVDGTHVAAFTLVRHRTGNIYYYAVKGVHGQTFKKYLGKHGEIDLQVFLEIKEAMGKIIADYEAENSKLAHLHKEIRELKLENNRLRRQLVKAIGNADNEELTA